jgi:ABC-2 type transport system ATP-binding protein
VAGDRLPGVAGGQQAHAAESAHLNGAAVAVQDLRHRYGDRQALAGITFAVREGEMFGLLGPNGSGKSTLLRILSTLLRPEGGAARIVGHDVVAEPDLVRRALGVVFQQASVDRKLTVEENLTCHASLYGMSGQVLADRLETTLERLGIAARRGERVERLSGGLERRVELAKALLIGARVLLLDEPSTALDPGARRDFLGYLRELRDAAGLTVLLSTHDLEEAERCDRVAIFDAGRIVALGTPDELKAAVGGDVLVVRATAPEALRPRLAARLGVDVQLVDGTLRVEHPRGHELVREVMEVFSGEVRAVTVGKPTLGDVFVRLTGHGLTETV